LWVPGRKTIFLPSVPQVHYFATARGRFGTLERGRVITVREYNRIVGRETVWMDEPSGVTTVTFPEVFLSDHTKRRTATMTIRVPSEQARVVALGTHGAFVS
jgi:hypothetical protein